MYNKCPFMYITCAACVWMCLNNSSTKEISHQSFCCSRKAWNKTPQWLQNCSHQPTDYCRFIKGFYFKNHRPEVPSPCNSSRLWRWCASHRPGIPISEHFGLFFFFTPLRRTVSRVFFSFSFCKRLHLRRGKRVALASPGRKWKIPSVSVMTDGDDTHPAGAVFVLYGEMRQGVESRHRDAGLRPNITAF